MWKALMVLPTGLCDECDQVYDHVLSGPFFPRRSQPLAFMPVADLVFYVIGVSHASELICKREARHTAGVWYLQHKA